MQGAQIPFLVEELRSRVLHGLAKKKKKKTLQLGLQHSKGANRRVGSFKKLDCTSSSSVSIVELPRSPRLLVGGPQPLVILTGLCYGGKVGEGTLSSVHSAPIHLHSPYRFCCLPHKELYFRAMVTLFFDVKDWKNRDIPTLWYYKDWDLCTYIPLCSLLSHVWLFVTLWTVPWQPPLSVGILQGGILEWVAMLSSWGPSQPRDLTHLSHISCIGRQMGSLPLVPPGKPPVDNPTGWICTGLRKEEMSPFSFLVSITFRVSRATVFQTLGISCYGLRPAWTWKKGGFPDAIPSVLVETNVLSFFKLRILSICGSVPLERYTKQEYICCWRQVHSAETHLGRRV